VTSVDATFEIVDWNDEPYDEPDVGPKLTRVTVSKHYRGAIDGTGVAHVLTVQGAQGGGYVASERVAGTLDGHTGTFVIQHGGLADGNEQSTFGTVIAGSGTGELIGIRGTAAEMSEGVLTLDYTLPADT